MDSPTGKTVDGTNITHWLYQGQRSPCPWLYILTDEPTWHITERPLTLTTHCLHLPDYKSEIRNFEFDYKVRYDINVDLTEVRLGTVQHFRKRAERSIVIR